MQFELIGICQWESICKILLAGQSGELPALPMWSTGAVKDIDSGTRVFHNFSTWIFNKSIFKENVCVVFKSIG